MSALFKSDAFAFVDEFGPEKIVYLSTPAAGLEAIVVIDNVAAGPAIGGVRMAPDVGVEECFRLARAMTLKNAACGLRHGGAKSVIFGDPAMPMDEKERVIRAFAKGIEPLTDYIPGPDMGLDETCMAFVHDEIGRAVGLPAELGGVPLDEIGATGFGVAIAAEVAAPRAGLSLSGARVVVEGFGAVGRHAARFLARRGAVLVGASDRRGAIYDARGLDIEALSLLRAKGMSVSAHSVGERLGSDALLRAPCDIFIPAARPDVLRADNVETLDCKLVVEGANIPATAEAERRLFERGIVAAPDFIANAGGVICAAVEYAGGDAAAAFAAIEEKIGHNMRRIVERADAAGVSLRDAATSLVEQRLRKMNATRRWHA
ncbi:MULTISPECIES: Glu/Leu/Phe/Val family dehydrogenase [Methylosinus]|uniref:Glutamate dehydrogenase n=1 Tax=Methylosinus trichosporium (strain ATCC 35070 / NCIMB 11131 / UNIQEM 75 / OB3b) TaxID=595536 RepID=A0A2D2CY05_METT3|nr:MULTISPECIES: Glu/Leu/Phe/Val dehydrogenase [Methylosinus]ATQ67613.1 Glu/Leu/Phe/Val dehydrogenase [Methylosinus trichosporium OB3b]OBS52155.1 glutamate dehydrogenase [Methylosinus sp. 3S-1]